MSGMRKTQQVKMIPDRLVLEVVARSYKSNGGDDKWPGAWYQLVDLGWNGKVALRKLESLEGKRWLDVGSFPTSPFLSPEGSSALEDMRASDPGYTVPVMEETESCPESKS